DTISGFDTRTQQGNGFSFTDYNETTLLKCIEHALVIYQNKQMWNVLVKNAMQCDFSWEASADKYVALYHKAMQKHKLKY
ncbi:MAG TPA: hypothetical protein PK467_15005, partial [Candidatus Wallbacteria bacterium]|nr:hypothetical protein [Candidatus Wallbacteria bacterium]